MAIKKRYTTRPSIYATTSVVPQEEFVPETIEHIYPEIGDVVTVPEHGTDRFVVTDFAVANGASHNESYSPCINIKVQRIDSDNFVMDETVYLGGWGKVYPEGVQVVGSATCKTEWSIERSS